MDGTLMQRRPFIKGRERLYGSIGVGDGRGIGSEISPKSSEYPEAEVDFSGEISQDERGELRFCEKV